MGVESPNKIFATLLFLERHELNLPHYLIWARIRGQCKKFKIATSKFTQKHRKIIKGSCSPFGSWPGGSASTAETTSSSSALSMSGSAEIQAHYFLYTKIFIKTYYLDTESTETERQ